MAKKIKKSIPWLVFIVLAGLLVGAGFYSFLPPKSPGVKAVTTTTFTPQVTVGNQSPVVSAVDLNAGSAITLTDNTTTSVTCIATITDENGGDTVSSATATIYRSGVSNGSSCTDNDNDCYQDETCSLVNSGNTATATCAVSIWFHADPTDVGSPWSSEDWECYIIAADDAGATDSATDTTPVGLDTVLALEITSSIDYGNLAPGASTTMTATTTATTTGNAAIDVKIRGTDLATSTLTIAGGQQKYATTSGLLYDDVATIVMATTTESYKNLVLESLKPIQNNPVQATATDNIFWGIRIPAGQAPDTYTGTTTVAAKVKS